MTKKINLKDLLNENSPGFEGRKFGDALPTLDSVKASYDSKNDTLQEGRIKSNITKTWDDKNTILDDCRNFILEAVDAGGEDMARDLADTFKILSNYAMGEYKKSKR
mgnify:CR=1 FL=1